jgi:hypothetical protein
VRTRAIAVRALVIVLAAAAAAWVQPRFGAVFVGGESMAPALARGDLVVVRRDIAAARAGDIVLVEKAGWPAGILHRIDIVFADGSMRLRGDANPQADRESVALSRMRGVVIAVLPVSRARAAMRRLLGRWYNPASQSNSHGVDGETRSRARVAHGREGPRRLGGPHGRRAAPRFASRAASLKDRDRSG